MGKKVPSEDPSAMLNARLTSTAVTLASQTLPATSSNVDALVGPPIVARSQFFSKPLTCTTNPVTTAASAGRLASTSIAPSTHAKVTDYLNSISLSPLHLT